MALLITFLAAVSVVVGALVVKLTNNKEFVEHLSLAMALGALFALLIFDLGPEVMESAEKHGNIFVLVVVALGFGILVILDGFIPEHEDTQVNHNTGNAAHIGMISALAIMVHNFVEGMTVYNMLFADLSNGILFALGIALHNIPMGMMIYSTMIPHKRKEKVLLFGAITASTFIGGLLMCVLSGHLSDVISSGLVAAASGMIIYILVCELIPHVLKTKTYAINVIGCVLGVAVVFISTRIGG